MLTIPIGIFRLFLFTLVLIFFVSRLAIVSWIKGYTIERALSHRQVCCHWMMWVCGIKLDIKGTIHEGNYLYISNHRAYLDPVAQLTEIKALPVAKAEVLKLPIMGRAAKYSGAHFVKRESLKSRKEARSSIAETIENGQSILIYPEGTTIKTPTTGDFKPGTFHMAAKNKVQIIPIAIEYGHKDDPWIGPEEMPIHFFKQFGMRNKRIAIHYGDPMWDEDGDVLRKQVRTWIDERLVEMRRELGL